MIKDQIADAFQRYFHQYGFKKTSVDEVAHEMQISKKTIYQHFTSKEEILQYVLQRNAQVILRDILAQLPADADEGRKMEQLIRMIHHFAREFQKNSLSFELRSKIELAEMAYHQAYSQLIADLVAAGVEKGVFQSGDLTTTIHYVDLIVTDSVRWMFEHPDRPVEDETVRTVQKILD